MSAAFFSGLFLGMAIGFSCGLLLCRNLHRIGRWR